MKDIFKRVVPDMWSKLATLSESFVHCNEVMRKQKLWNKLEQTLLSLGPQTARCFTREEASHGLEHQSCTSLSAKNKS